MRGGSRNREDCSLAHLQRASCVNRLARVRPDRFEGSGYLDKKKKNEREGAGAGAGAGSIEAKE